METQLLPAPTQQPQQPPVVESALPQTHHEAYRMKLAGRAIQDIAESYGVDRTTIWRWCKAVEAEARKQIAGEPVFNLIVREIIRLTDLEEQARVGAENTKSDRAKGIYLSEARRAAVARQNLLITTGIFPKAPEQVFRITANMKPQKSGDDWDLDHVTRKLTAEEKMEILTKKLEQCRVLS